MSTQLTRALLLALPLVISSAPDSASAGADSAGSVRWQEVTHTQTFNDGLALTGAAFEGHSILGTLSLPFFELNGTRYELEDRYQSGAPQVKSEAGRLELSVVYRLPVTGGTAEVTLTHRLIDQDAQYRDVGTLRSTVKVRGPEGRYDFFWRIDPDLRGAGGDQVQVYQDLKGRGYWRAPESETRLALGGAGEFDRFKVRLVDGPDAVDQSRLWIENPLSGTAQVYVVRANAGEFDAQPGTLLNHQRLQTLSEDELVAQPLSGSNLVVWYQASATGSSFEVGPQLSIANISARVSVLEMDRMQSTEFPPATVQHKGKTESMQSAFATGQITMSKIYYDGTIPDKSRVNMSELDAIMEANVTYQATQDSPTQWYSWYGIAKTLDIPGVLGVMYDVTGYSGDTSYREGAFGLYDSIVDVLPQLEDAGYPPQNLGEYSLWTATHETGHAYNQHHEDFYYNDTSCFYANTAIMGYSYDAANELFWDFGPNSNTALASDPDDYVRPGHGVDFISSKPGPYPYNTTRSHKRGHTDTQQFNGGGCE